MDPRVARTRARVLAAASELLNEVGFEAVTIEAVSERSGVARSTLYRHWRTKGQLLRDAWAEQHAPAEPGTVGAAQARDRLVRYAAAVADGMRSTWGRSAATLAVSALDDVEQQAVLRTFTDGTREDLRRLVTASEGAAGLRPAEVERLVDALEAAVVAPLFYRFVFRRHPASAAEARRWAAAAWDSLGLAPG